MYKQNIYDNIDPENYEHRRKNNQREMYIYRHWEPLRVAAIKKYSSGLTVCDLGSGSGNHAHEIKKYAKKVVGVDSSRNMLAYAQKKYPGVDFIFADAASLPLKDASFDAVFSFGLFEYVDIANVLGEVKRILKPSGFLIMTVPNRYGFSRFPVRLFYKISKKKYIPHEPSFKEMMALFDRFHFNVIDYTMDDGLVWLPHFLDRLCGQKVYAFVERFFKNFTKNYFSDGMMFIVESIL